MVKIAEKFGNDRVDSEGKIIVDFVTEKEVLELVKKYLNW